MKTYIVFFEEEVQGVFDSKEQAESFLEKFKVCYNIRDEDDDFFFIGEHILNEENLR